MNAIAPLAAAVALLSSQASALTCLMPDPARTFQQLNAVPQPYHVLRGTLSFDATQMPMGANTGGDQQVMIHANFEGTALTHAGFTSPASGPVTLAVTCWGPWCGGLGADQEIVAFSALDADGGRTIALEPCPGHIFSPEPQVIDTLTACVNNGPCEDGTIHY